MTVSAHEFPHEEERVWDVLMTDDPWAPRQRRLRQPDRLRRWRLTWNVLSATEKGQLVTEFRTALGSAGTFSMTPADVGAAVTVRFVADTLRWDLVEPGRYQAQTEVEEVLHGITT